MSGTLEAQSGKKDSIALTAELKKIEGYRDQLNEKIIELNQEVADFDSILGRLDKKEKEIDSILLALKNRQQQLEKTAKPGNDLKIKELKENLRDFERIATDNKTHKLSARSHIAESKEIIRDAQKMVDELEQEMTGIRKLLSE
jgi:chromosome segregation ATPase